MEFVSVSLLLCQFIFAAFGNHIIERLGLHTRLQRDLRSVITVDELNVVSSVTMRFADVHIDSVISNMDWRDREVRFEVRIPSSAFIHRFWLTTDNKTIEAKVMEREEAAAAYSNAKEEDLTAGKVSHHSLITDIGCDMFTISVNVAARSRAKFYLQYQEVLQRIAGTYRQTIYIDSDYVIPKLSVTSEVRELEKFLSVSYQTPFAPDKQYSNIEEGVTEDGYYWRKIKWEPLEEEQSNMGAIVRPFVIEYELEPPVSGGYVYYNNQGEFAHLFSSPCNETYIMAKQIVFVIDVSGSMRGIPIKQVASAMDTILDQIRVNDYFDIILFSNKVALWSDSFIQATASNIRTAKGYLKQFLQANGATNINLALLEAVKLFGTAAPDVPGTEEIFGRSLVFLTDGEPTVGVKNMREIRENVRKANYFEGGKCCKVSIFTVAFGSDADIDFLRRVADENAGYMTIIRESSDSEAEDFLVELYRSVENPILRNLEFSFETTESLIPKQNVTENEFLQYDCGSEIIIAGWTKPGLHVISTVHAEGLFEKVQYNTVPTQEVSSVNAELLTGLVTYKKVKELLKIAELSNSELVRNEALQSALSLALKYEFVTPVTSLVVTELVRKTFTGNFQNKGGPGSSGHQYYDDLLPNASDYEFDYAFEWDNLTGSTSSASYSSTMWCSLDIFGFVLTGTYFARSI